MRESQRKNPGSAGMIVISAVLLCSCQHGAPPAKPSGGLTAPADPPAAIACDFSADPWQSNTNAWTSSRGVRGPNAIWDADTGIIKLDVSDKTAWIKTPRATINPGDLAEARMLIKNVSDKSALAHPTLVFRKGDKTVSTITGGTPYGNFPAKLQPFEVGSEWLPAVARGISPPTADNFFFLISFTGAGAEIWIDDSELLVTPQHATRGIIDKNPIVADIESLSSNDYVIARNGKLFHGARQLRIWAAQGNLLALTHADIDWELDRFQEHGFNGFRSLWWMGIEDSYVPGDDCAQDRWDYLIAAMGRRNIYFWCDFLNGCAISPEDVDVIADPATAEAWRAAVAQMHKGNKRLITRRAIASVWDPRMKEIYFRHIRAVLNHYNPYNGLKYAEDPAFFCWELTNEEWWITRILWGNHLKLPIFFQQGLYAQWNQWLRNKYISDQALAAAWDGLLEGESLQNETVKLLPILGQGDSNPFANAVGLNVDYATIKFRPDDFAPQRAADIMEFLTDLYLNYKREAARVFRSQGRQGLGCQIVPLLFDTGYSGSIHNLYLHSFSDAVPVGFYLDMSVHSPSSPTFPFASGLTSPPWLSDWLDNRRVKGKPTFVYENMIFAPQKYRAEYFYRLMALAALQDFAVVDFHYYGHPRPFPRIKNPHGTSPMQYMRGHLNTYGLNMREDEIIMSAARVAGTIFKNGYIKPLPNPATVTLGARTLWSFDGLKCEKYSEAARHTAYRKGFQWDFNPNVPHDSIMGELVQPSAIRNETATIPHEQIAYRWREGIMVVDTPEAKTLAGFVPESFHFKDGLTLHDIRFHIPAEMPFIIPGERYMVFGMAATDGKPLEESGEILISALNTSFNTGFDLNLENMRTDKAYAAGLGRSIISPGKSPAIIGRPDLTVSANWLHDRHYQMLDYNGNMLAEGMIEGNALKIPGNIPLYMTIIRKHGP